MTHSTTTELEEAVEAFTNHLKSQVEPDAELFSISLLKHIEKVCSYTLNSIYKEVPFNKIPVYLNNSNLFKELCKKRKFERWVGEWVLRRRLREGF